jgi:cupin 2 domain-containing protein
MPALSNLFAEVPAQLHEEVVETLLAAKAVRIERIVSLGHASPEAFWYDQEHQEWVLLLKGAARLRFKDVLEPLELRPGDYINIPAHRLHRVEWTMPDGPTIWLAVHYA